MRESARTRLLREQIADMDAPSRRQTAEQRARYEMLCDALKRSIDDDHADFADYCRMRAKDDDA